MHPASAAALYLFPSLYANTSGLCSKKRRLGHTLRSAQLHTDTGHEVLLQGRSKRQAIYRRGAVGLSHKLRRSG